MRTRPRIIAGLIATLLLALSFLLQSPRTAHAAPEAGTGTITGRVTAKGSDEPLPNANVVVLGTNRGATTDLDGRYRIEKVEPGVYAVQASVLGYGSLVRTDIVVSPSRPAEVDFVLQPTTLELEAVEFTAGFFRKDSDYKVSTTVQSSEEIRRLPGGFEDVARAVSILPGVAQASPGRNDLVVRGGAPSENLYLVDGIQVPNINHFGTQGATGGPQSFINLDFVDNTTFSTGGFGVRYGDKLSSVLGIDLRGGRHDRIGGKATVSASQFGLNLEGPIEGERGAWVFSARRSYLDFIFKAAGFAFVPEYWDFLAKAHYDLTERDQIRVLAISAIDNVRLFNDTPDQRYDNARVPASDQYTAVGGLTWKRVISGGVVNTTLSQTVQTFNTVQQDSLLNPIFSNESRQVETSLRSELLLGLGETLDLTLGARHTLIDFEADLFLRPFQTTFGPTLSVDRAYDASTFKSAAYGELTKRWGPLTLSGGLRADYFDQLDEGFAWAPRASATWAFNMLTRLNGSIGRYYQSPSMIWLATNSSNRENLTHIGADQVVLGIEHLLREDVRLSLEGFYKDYFDYPASTTRPWLVMANTGAGYSGTQDNFAAFGLDPLVPAGEGFSRGFELFAQKKAAENPHYAIASLTWSETYFTPLDGVRRPGTYDQRWIFNLGGGFIFSQRLEVSGRFRFATGIPYTPWEPDGSQDPAKALTARTDPNHSLDLRADYRWFFDTVTLITYLDVQNVYNNAYKSPPRWDEREGEAVQGSSIGLLPSIGISLEF